jgi:hypothetical protein
MPIGLVRYTLSSTAPRFATPPDTPKAGKFFKPGVITGFPGIFGAHDVGLPRPTPSSEGKMIVLGVILLIIGWLTGISILYTVGAILLVVGLVLLLLGSIGHGVGGRRWYF